MVMVTLAQPDLALLADLDVRVALPHLLTAPLSRAYGGALVTFAGDSAPTAFRSTGRAVTLPLTCRYARHEHAQLAALLDLLDAAAAAPDGRLLFRPHYGQVGRLNEPIIGVVFGVDPTPAPGGVVDVAFTLQQTAGTVGV